MNRVYFRFALVLVVFLALLPVNVFAQGTSATAATTNSAPLLLRFPSLSQDKIAFRYADDIWTVSRNGGEAERLTANGHVTAGPFYSPDGAWIAYSAHLDGNTDAYIIPRREGCPGASPGTRQEAAWWAGRRMARTF